MQPDPLDEGRRWLDQARQDLDDARYLREGDRHNLACFHSQQAAEKAHPNGLPGGLPAKAFDRDDADAAIDRAARIVEAVSGAFGQG